MTPRPPTYSTATLDSLVCPVAVDTRLLCSGLPPGLTLPQLPQFPAGRHPIIVEIWRVQNGLIHFGNVTAHGLWELAGSTVGFGVGGNAGAALGAGIGGLAGAASGGALGMWFGPLGWWWGAATGASSGAAAGAAMMGTTGAALGARWAGDAARKTSETNSRVIGTYNEIIVTVPCRRSTPVGEESDFAFVIGTYTDSVASMLGEWIVGWGYQKTRALGTHVMDGVLEVRSGSTGSLFRVSTCPASSPQTVDELHSSASVLACMARPLLGALPEKRLAVSFMDRWYDNAAVRMSPTSVRLEAGDEFVPGLPGFATELNAVSERDPWGAFLVTGLPVTLSYPRTIED